MTKITPTNNNDAAPADTLLTIDLDALSDNFAHYQSLAFGAEVAGVVKANAYGLGLAPVVRAMAAAGCKTFFVTNANEGMALRALLPEAAIYLVNGLPAGAGPAARAANLRPCLGSLVELAEWSRESDIAGHPLPAALHFDTGMNRLGFDAKETTHLLAQRDAIKNIDVSLIMSHLACADEPDHSLNKIQLERFTKIAAAFPDTPKSLANSAGVLLGAEYCFDLVRPGYGMFGGAPVGGRKSPFLSVVTAQARVLQVRNVGPGEAAGYGASWQAEGPRRLATLSMGYADGYDRTLSSNAGAARVYIAGHFAPLAGRISMDLLMVDITALPADAVQRGDLAELIGPHISLEEVAARAGTIGYEVLTSLGDRYIRHYTSRGVTAES